MRFFNTSNAGCSREIQGEVLGRFISNMTPFTSANGRVLGLGGLQQLKSMGFHALSFLIA